MPLGPLLGALGGVRGGSVTQLSLLHMPGGIDVAALGSLLRSSRVLSVLNVPADSISASSMTTLCDALSSAGCELTSLNVSRNGGVMAAAQVLCKAVASKASLTHLNVSLVGMMPESVRHFADMIACGQLTTLDMGSMRMGAV
jgi:hypothetical protein